MNRSVQTIQSYFFIKEKSRYVKVNFDDIMYVEGCGNYLKIVTETKKYMALTALKRIEKLLRSHQFVRIHKSYIVSLLYITEFDRNNVYLHGTKLPVGNQFKGVVERSVVIVNGDSFKDLAPVPINYLERAG